VPLDLSTQFDTVRDKHRADAPSGLREPAARRQPYIRPVAARLTVAQRRMARVALRRS
jgi:hypothetical protein